MISFISKNIKSVLITCGAGIILVGSYLSFKSKKTRRDATPVIERDDDVEGRTVVVRENTVSPQFDLLGNVDDNEENDEDDGSPIPMIEVLRISEDEEDKNREASQG